MRRVYMKTQNSYCNINAYHTINSISVYFYIGILLEFYGFEFAILKLVSL